MAAKRPRTRKRPIQGASPSSAPSQAAPLDSHAKNGETYTLRGMREAGESQIFLKTSPELGLTVKAAFVPPGTRSGVSMDSVEVAADDIIEVEFVDGERLWMRGDEFHARIDGASARGEADEGVTQVPADLRVLPIGFQERGPINWAVKALNVLGVDLAGIAAEKIARAFEQRTSPRKRPPGLYRCALATDGFALEPLALHTALPEEPHLVYIHGPASSTWGSFGDLWHPSRQIELDALRAAYGVRVLAFEHASLTRSPIQNALDLVKLLADLPDGAPLHLVTHSGGGLVGELLCRSRTVKMLNEPGGDLRDAGDSVEPFQPEEFELFAAEPERYKGYREQLKELDGLLRQKCFRVERFVRIACPALGTTLASERIDRWFSILGSLAAAALPDTPLADVFKDLGDFIVTVIGKRVDPSSLPGLEAMMPGSAVIKIVNWPEVTVAGDLVVISGDIEPEARWARLLVWATDRFYDGDHDLVVNTPSMYGGAKRPGRSWISFHKGPEVNHFRYLQNPASAQSIVKALTGTVSELEGFEPLKKPAVDIARAVVSRDAGPRPVVFVLPGIMGSELESGGNLIWLDLRDLMRGRFGRLSIDAEGVTALRPFARYYGELIEYLADTHKVVPFAFDWRLPVEREADRLAQAVQLEYEQATAHQQPVRLLAHSMGGLVARTLIARHPALWRDLCQIPGARLVMLGTPNGGSHSITELLVGRSAILRKLAFLDTDHSTQDLLAIIACFPGVLSMLPLDRREDYFSTEVWKSYFRFAEGKWGLPPENALAQARAFRQMYDHAPIDPEHMVYVAGCADATIVRMYADPQAKDSNGRIRFEATTRGDGRVTWESGIPAGVPVWYMEEVEHGDLPAHPPAFSALLELLEQGRTSLLPQTPPLSRAAEILFPMPRAVDDLYPDEDGLAGTVLGAGSRKRRSKARGERPVQVRVLHGNLSFASHPVAVGHYAGDTIISAEKDLDRQLGGALTRRIELGIYPGPIESSAVFVNPRPESQRRVSLKGAVVVGLGTVGNLTSSLLTRTFARALLEYVVEWGESMTLRASPGPAAAGGLQEFGISALLIGTGAGGISVSESVYALLKAVRGANSALAQARSSQRIGCLEFIELWEDRAIQAVRALKTFGSRPSMEQVFQFDGRLQTRKGGLRRPRYQEPAGWWQRLQVLGKAREGEPSDGALRFSASTRRARTEVRLLATQRALVDQFIEQSIRTTSDQRSVARTLFELLLPNEIKDQAPDQDDVVFILDEEAARYPWELLDDRAGSNRKPIFVEHGLIRQMESTEFREAVRGAAEPWALVIGDPVSKLPELKGAQAEAEAVGRSLQHDGRFQVETRIRPDSRQVMGALFLHSYRILHLSGHGVYRFIPDEALRCTSCDQSLPASIAQKQKERLAPMTGMIIGDGVVLSPREVRQMRFVPELVFINCCHLGRVEPGAALNSRDPGAHRDYNRIAANVATEFIRMGVRAVVAAGWAVDDRAAVTFATTFYEQMLNGQPFGKAVKEARQAAFKGFPTTNTWGAYQCYGDPDFRLIKAAGAIEEEEKPSFVTPSEAVAELNDIYARLSTLAGQDTRAERRRIRQLARWLKENNWLVDGRVCAALARAFGEVRDFDQAVTYYERALKAEDGQVTFKDVEQLANLQTRQAERLWADGKPEAARNAVAAAIQRLEFMLHSVSPGEPRAGEKDLTGLTVERLSLLGGAYKRLAWVDATGRAAALRRMADCYRQAYELSVEKKDFDSYPLLNWLTAEMVGDWQAEDRAPLRERVPGFADFVEKIKGALSRSLEQVPDFWKAVMLADVEVLAALLDAVDRFDEQRLEALAEKYREARCLGSPREYASILGQLDFLMAMAGDQKKTVNLLLKLKQRVAEP